MSKPTVTLLKKIVSKNLVSGKIKDLAKAIENDQENALLYKIVGQAESYKTGESNYGPWVSFSGNFEAYNTEGNIFKSNVAFIQEPLQSMIVDVLNGDSESCEFGLSVSIKRRDDLEVGYEYIISPLIEIQETDSLSHLRQLALAAPEVEVETETKPADKKAAKK